MKRNSTGGAASGPRGRSPSIRDVATSAGVSIASVSRVMNEGSGRVSPQTRQKVVSAVEALNYNTNHIGRALRVKSTNTYALILSNIQNNFYAAVAWELERLLSERGKAFLLYTSNESPEIQDRCLEDILHRRVSGIFVLCAVQSRRLQDMVEHHPVVFINRRIRSLSGASFIGIDDHAAARDLTEAAVRRRRGPVAIISGPLSSDTSARRLHGMLDACARLNQPIANEHRRESKLSMEGGYDAAVSLLSGIAFSAVLCGNDQIAYGVYRRCRELGLSVPDELSIYGFDDNPLNEWLAIWLNTVRVPHLDFARAAVDEMELLQVGRLAHEIIIPYQLVLRA